MKQSEWISNNILSIIVALIVLNFVLISWGAMNFGFGARKDLNLYDLSAARNKTLLLQQEASTATATDTSVTRLPVASSSLKLTCSDDDLGTAFAAVRPAVVNITADKATTSKRGGSSMTTTADTLLFDDPAIRFVEEQSLGTGIIVDSRGFIVTNAHVVATAQNVKVIVFSFERKAYAAEIVLKDIAHDIAVLRIYPERPLPTVVLGDSAMVKVADRVMAVGAPFGLEQSVTAGIISDDKRNLVIDGMTYENMIQTDAAINRGNSGGPLVNGKGEIIGITTAIYAPTGVFTGIGFAIPINQIKPIVKEALAR